MKPKDYTMLMVAALAAMLFAFAMPCRAYWVYEGYDTCDDDPNGYYYESGADYEFEESYTVSNIDTYADSGGAYASADCQASASVEVMPQSTSLSKSADAWCTTWGEAYYSQPSGSDRLDYDWSLSASGSVTVDGGIDDSGLASADTADSSAFAGGSIGCSGEDGTGGASGSVSQFSTGNASYSLGGYAAEDYADTSVAAGYYYATLSFSVDASGTGYTTGSQFTASADVDADASCSADVSASPGYGGSSDASASADCGGSSSVSVSF